MKYAVCKVKKILIQFAVNGKQRWQVSSNSKCIWEHPDRGCVILSEYQC